jgi:hypothetical protein
MLNKAHPDGQVDAKVIGVFCHSRYLKGRYVYMIHARNAVLQESVASTLAHYKIPMVRWPLYNAAREMATMEKGMADFKGKMMTAVGAKLTSEDRRSLGRRYWNIHKISSRRRSTRGFDEGAQHHGLGGGLTGAE